MGFTVTKVRRPGGRRSPLRPCCFSVLAERRMAFPCPPVCGNFKSGRFPSVLILATSSSAEEKEQLMEEAAPPCGYWPAAQDLGGPGGYVRRRRGSTPGIDY